MGEPTLDDSLLPVEPLGQALSTAVVLFHEAVAARVGLSSAEWKCLSLLARSGPTTAGRIAEMSGFTTGAITGIVDRLEKAGYVRREPNPRDRRSVIVHPLRCDEIGEAVARIFASLNDAMQVLASRFNEAELAAIQEYLAGTTEVLERETARLNGGAGGTAASPGSAGADRPT